MLKDQEFATHKAGDRRRICGRLVLLVALTDCGGGPPDFAVIQEQVGSAGAEGARTISIGTPATPPPGEYRFVTLHADGSVEAREIVTFNGPEPWVTYVGGARVPVALAREALGAIDAMPPESVQSNDPRAPCVLAFVSASGSEWRGCAYPTLAADVLSRIPRLTAPGVSNECGEQPCQVRFLWQEPGVGHANARSISQDIVFGKDGTFWCAAIDRDPQRAAWLRVVRGRIDGSRSGPVFQWLTAPVDRTAVEERSSPLSEAVMVRARGEAWSLVRTPKANETIARLRRIAESMPQECRPRR
jgi:hypothetical protein